MGDLMAYYVCNRCNRVFSEDEAETETFRHDEIRPVFTERFIVCPSCLSANFDDAAFCYRCHRPVRYEDLRGGYYCRECMHDISDRYHEHKYIAENIDDYAEWLHEQRARNNADEQDEKDRL
jgi:hypothetical protein